MMEREESSSHGGSGGIVKAADPNLGPSGSETAAVRLTGEPSGWLGHPCTDATLVLLPLSLCQVLPHLGASTEEAEDNSAAMAADTIMTFMSTGVIRNSINFPETKLEKLNR